MTGKRYETDDDVIGAVRSHVEDLPEKSCWNVIKKCFQRNNYLEDVHYRVRHFSTFLRFIPGIGKSHYFGHADFNGRNYF